jgi:hypothetical protein
MLTGWVLSVSWSLVSSLRASLLPVFSDWLLSGSRGLVLPVSLVYRGCFLCSLV